ncbi:hypothetical protein DHEL01_v210191 [Diaporthe helianthi]|uniref:Uncharacterized protein n=1 Tax=Diaporthe helianthi TaxID=158607 RepID=A0A2P5HME3_DIAHE|nr:hypothetical protein DHEL01_v210191 [Diaporthe helianthi]
MTTNSYGSALPKFGYPSIQPAVPRASALKALPLPVRIVSVAAAAGIAICAGTRPLIQQQRELHATGQPSESILELRKTPGDERSVVAVLATVTFKCLRSRCALEDLENVIKET